jgi:hypothetical protein
VERPLSACETSRKRQQNGSVRFRQNPGSGEGHSLVPRSPGFIGN